MLAPVRLLAVISSRPLYQRGPQGISLEDVVQTFRSAPSTSFPPLPCHSRAGGNPELFSFPCTTALHIPRALQKANGIVCGPTGAAASLGINPRTSRSKMKKLGITYGRRRG